jgi:hypothetical protein
MSFSGTVRANAPAILRGRIAIVHSLNAEYVFPSRAERRDVAIYLTVPCALGLADEASTKTFSAGSDV